MIESKIQTNTATTSTQIDNEKYNKYKTYYHMAEGIVGGMMAGEAFAWLAPIKEDSFEKAEKELREKVAPIDGKKEEWNKLINKIVKNEREYKFGGLGMLAGAAIALLFIYNGKSKSQSEN